MRISSLVTIAIPAVLIFISACSYLPTTYPLPATGVSVRETRAYIELRPASASRTGFMFYPGGLVDAHAYIGMLSVFAQRGYAVMIVKMPANLAVLDIDAGYKLRSEIRGVDQWVIGGHSLGGAMAAASVKQHQSDYAGLVLMAAYPSSGDSLASWTRAVLSISASKDGLSTPEKITNSIILLPSGKWLYIGDRSYPPTNNGYSVFHVIPGGCHAQFGSYGAQDGDGTPTLSETDQHAEIADYMDEFFTNNRWTNR